MRKGLKIESRTMPITTKRLVKSVIPPLLLLIYGVAAVAQPNPYQVIYHWGTLPGDRTMGVVTGVHPDPDGEHLWIVERCGANQCAGSDLNPIHKLDRDGNAVKSIGAGLFAWPHGFDAVSYTHLTLPTKRIV